MPDCRLPFPPQSWGRDTAPCGAARLEGEETMKDWMKQWRRLLVRVGLLPPAELHYIGGSDTLPPPLSREREAELLERIGEEDARKELIEHNLRLVVYIARRFENTGVGIEDLISIGTIGLIKDGQEHQAGHLCLPVHRERDFDVPAQKCRAEGGGVLRRAAEHRLGRQ